MEVFANRVDSARGCRRIVVVAVLATIIALLMGTAVHAGLPNLVIVPGPPGWEAPIIPRNLPDAVWSEVPQLPAKIYGSQTKTYFNFCYNNIGTADTEATFDVDLFVDNARRYWMWQYAPYFTNDPSYWLNAGPFDIMGGRHTVWTFVDSKNAVPELNENDNKWGHQFVWMPWQLQANKVVQFMPPPTKDAWGPLTSGDYNCHGYSFEVPGAGSQNRWCAVGILSNDAGNTQFPPDNNLRLYDPSHVIDTEHGFDNSFISHSDSAYSSCDFIVVNGRVVPGTYFASVVNWNDNSDLYRIEQATSTTDLAPRPGWLWNGAFTIDPLNVLDIYELNLPAGKQVFRLDNVDMDPINPGQPSVDLSMALYQTTGACAKAFQVPCQHSGGLGPGDMEFAVDVSAGNYGLVVWKTDGLGFHKSGKYRIAYGPPCINVSFPTWSSKLYQRSSATITWDNLGKGTNSNVRIEFSSDNGATWSEVTSSTSNTGSFPWPVPSTLSNACRLKITSTTDPSYTGISDTFNILKPTIKVTSPNGGESWFVGQDKTITWDAPNLADVVRIYVSRNSGGSWECVPACEILVPNTGSYVWQQVPYPLSDNCRIKVASAADPTIFDTSNANFSITGAEVRLLAPNGGETWSVGSLMQVSWSADYVSNVKIELSRDSGTTWETITSSTPNVPSSYPVTVTPPASTHCRVRVSSADTPAVNDISIADFSIAAPQLAIISGYVRTADGTPMGGVTMNGFPDSTVTDEGGYYLARLTTGWSGVVTPSYTGYGFTPESITYDNIPGNLSNQNYTGCPPSIRVTSPDGGETWTIGQAVTVTWNNTGDTGNYVDVDLSLDGGTSWSNIGASVPNSGSCDWTCNGINPSALVGITLPDQR